MNKEYELYTENLIREYTFFEITKNGKKLSEDKYIWNKKDRTIICFEENIEINAPKLEHYTLVLGDKFKVITGSRCDFLTGSYGDFLTGDECIFKTSNNCIFRTGFGSRFWTGDTCDFLSTEDGGYFLTGNNCKFYDFSYSDIISGNNALIEYPFCSTIFTGKNSIIKEISESDVSVDIDSIIYFRDDEKIEIKNFRNLIEVDKDGNVNKKKNLEDNEKIKMEFFNNFNENVLLKFNELEKRYKNE
jgi:hypothetical protein